MDFQKLRAAADAAKACQATTGLPAEVSMAQWADESGWGAHSPGFNCFGIKAFRGAYGTQELTTHETINGEDRTVKQTFATFPTLQACFEKHAQLITEGPRYQKAWTTYQATGDVAQLIRQIAPIYATDPRYGEKLLTLTRMQQIQASLQQA
jgi:flagellar protein FlgJ